MVPGHAAKDSETHAVKFDKTVGVTRTVPEFTRKILPWRQVNLPWQYFMCNCKLLKLFYDKVPKLVPLFKKIRCLALRLFKSPIVTYFTNRVLDKEDANLVDRILLWGARPVSTKFGRHRVESTISQSNTNTKSRPDHSAHVLNK